MAINLEMPKKLQAVIEKGHQGAAEMLRPISRKYDLKEHAYPVELDTLASLFEGISDAKTISFAGAEAFRDADDKDENHNGANMSAILNVLEVSWGDVALMLSVKPALTPDQVTGILQSTARAFPADRKSTRLNSSHTVLSRMPSSA